MRPDAQQTWLTAINLQRGRMGFGAPSTPRKLSEDVQPKAVYNGKDTETGQYVIKKIAPWHERLVDYMLLNPHAKMDDLAKEFKVTPQWVSGLLRTDAFKAYYHKRMETHQQAITDAVINRTASVANKALDKVAEKLEEKNLPLSELRSTAEMAIRALGYGAPRGGQALGVQVNVNQHGAALPVMSVPTNVVEDARNRMASQRNINTAAVAETTDEYMRVTASMQVTPESVAEGVEDAVVVPDGTGEAGEGE